MEGDRHREPAVEKAFYCLLEGLDDSNLLEIPFLFRNYYDCLPCAFLVQRSILEVCLHDGKNLQPIGDVRKFVLCCSNQPLVEVFRSHS